MVTQLGPTGTLRRRRPTSEDAARWSAVAAVLLGLAGVADVVRWGNRWYVTEVFARDAGTPDGASWEYVYGLLDNAHQALVRGFVLALLAGALATVAVVLRRRAAR